MTGGLFEALARGATVATATPRLARSLRQEFGARQMASGRTAWPTPSILTWGAFTERLWEGDSAPPLTPVQELALWESIVSESPESADLIQPGAAARLASDAWRLIHDWRIPLAGRKHAAAWQATAEAAAFFGWAQQFQFHTRWLDRIEPARMGEVLASRELRGPSELWLAGFDEFTPRQKELCAALERSGTTITQWVAPIAAAFASLAEFADARHEEDAAAAWCRRRLEEDPRARIGVIVHDLEGRRHRFERAFHLAAPNAFHVALGPPLAGRPMVAAALGLLQFGGERLPWEAVSSLLLSPWVAGYSEERAPRAAFEVTLRRWRAAELTAASVARQQSCPPTLSRALRGAGELRASWPDEQSPSAWSAAFTGLLSAFGWPGNGSLSGEEYQVLEEWRDTLSELASTGLTVRSVTRARACAMLHSLAQNKRFETESTGEPIQIMGIGEAAGARFDSLWIAGMNDEAWPARPAPNPFVPLALQRQYNLPHSSPARELAYAARISQRLLESSSEVVVSYAKADSERETGPSPLFAELPAWSHEPALEAGLTPAALERIEDRSGPPVPPGATTSGGTRALELQAKCPFRAFAEIRLGARQLDVPEPGLDPRERGGFLHGALELFWKRFPSSSELRAADPPAVAEAVSACVDQTLAQFHTGDDPLASRLVALERVRLIELLSGWIALEKDREIAFTVEEPEQQRVVEIGGVTVQVRLDRLDKLANGSYALVDYKSTAPRLADWDGERPESPQVPVYAVTAREPLAAIAFAQVRTGDNLFRGYSTIDGALPGVKPIERAALSERIAEWREVLRGLGEAFRAGEAAVDPKLRYKTCEQCYLAALCRVEEKKK